MTTESTLNYLTQKYSHIPIKTEEETIHEMVSEMEKKGILSKSLNCTINSSIWYYPEEEIKKSLRDTVQADKRYQNLSNGRISLWINIEKAPAHLKQKSDRIFNDLKIEGISFD